MIKIEAESITISGDIQIGQEVPLNKTIEFTVRPVTRYIVTSYSRVDRSGSSENCGEFDNVRQANRVANALALSEAKSYPQYDVYYKLYSHEYDESEFPNNGLIKV